MKKSPVTIGPHRLEAGNPLLVGVIASPGWESSDWRKADILELRLDRFLAREKPGKGGREGTDTVGLVEGIRRLTSKPVLLTIRHPEESDCRDCEPREDSARVALFEKFLPYCQAVDIEVGAPYAASLFALAGRLGRPAVGSWHDFRRTPPENLLYEKMRRARNLGASVFKIACRVEKPVEAISILNFCRLFSRSFPLAVAPMGGKSQVIRLSAPFFGSVLVYAALGEETAPGQPGLSSLRADLDRFYRSRHS